MEDHFEPRACVSFSGYGRQSYSDHVICSYYVTERAMPLLIRALAEIDIHKTSKKAFTLAEYGAADGGTSLAIIAQLIEKIKERYGSEQEIQILYEDQAKADYNKLFQILHGMKQGNAPTYLKQNQNLFVSACATNFYKQCFISESIHLGFSFTAAHFLSHRPCKLKSSISNMLSTDEKEKTTFAEVAKHDWELFLVNRAKELVTGGYMAMGNLGTNEQGQFSGNSIRVKNCIRQNFDMYWSQLVNEGVITKEEFNNTTMNDYHRTEEESSQPFRNKDSIVSKMNLKLLHIETVFLECPLHTSWLKSENKDDAEAKREYARKFIAHMRAWSNSTFMNGLSQLRSMEEKRQIVDELFARYEVDVAIAPEEHAADYVHIYLLITKKLN